MNNWVQRALGLVGQIPTTQGQFCIAAVVTLGTASRYLLSGILFAAWEPSVAWLAFMLSLWGVATTQFVAKRATDHTYVATKASAAKPGATP